MVVDPEGILFVPLLLSLGYAKIFCFIFSSQNLYFLISLFCHCSSSYSEERLLISN